jgi:hypothetical protein
MQQARKLRATTLNRHHHPDSSTSRVSLEFGSWRPSAATYTHWLLITPLSFVVGWLLLLASILIGNPNSNTKTRHVPCWWPVWCLAAGAVSCSWIVSWVMFMFIAAFVFVFCFLFFCCLFVFSLSPQPQHQPQVISFFVFVLAFSFSFLLLNFNFEGLISKIM